MKFRKHIHVILTMEDGGLLVYSDIRRFGELRLIGCEADHPPLLKMAPEPFEEEACQHFLDMAAMPKYARKPIKEVIMDGHVISGLRQYLCDRSIVQDEYSSRKNSRTD